MAEKAFGGGGLWRRRPRAEESSGGGDSIQSGGLGLDQVWSEKGMPYQGQAGEHQPKADSRHNARNALLPAPAVGRSPRGRVSGLAFTNPLAEL